MEEHAYEGQVAIRLESADLTVAPGSSVNVRVTLPAPGYRCPRR
jgi:hypothetical protein